MTAAILVGGGSRRMGSPKAWVEIGGVSAIARVLRSCRAAGLESIFQGRDDRITAAYPHIPAFADDAPGQGPLAALVTAFRCTQAEAMLLVACDMPFLPAPLLARLAEVLAESALDWVVPVQDGRLHPLCGVYRRTAAAKAASLLAAGRRSMHDLLSADGLGGCRVEPDPRWGPPEMLLMNVNTPQDLETARLWAQRSGR